jgi:protein arginine N-methyltransferase 1
MRSPRRGGGEYDLRAYGSMVADTVRMAAYRDALARCIRPGDVVVDVGAGTGIMSLLACQLGARRVHAIEPADALAVGRELAAANGYADRIEFHACSSLEVTLPEPADVLVSDLRGILPLHGAHLGAVIDARRRLLAPGGRQIPLRDTVFAQLVADEAFHAETVQAWRDGAFGLDLSPALRWAAHQWRKVDLGRARLAGEPRAVFQLDYATIGKPDAHGEAQWMLDRAETVHGVGAWFDTVLTDGVGFSNAPDRPRAIYGQAFFPFTEPLQVEAGGRVAVRLGASLVGGHYIWQWDTTVTDASGGQRARLQQSTFQAGPISPAQLLRRAADHQPRPTAHTRAAARALALIDQRRSVADIAWQLEAEFPELFVPGKAHEFVADLCDWLGE